MQSKLLVTISWRIGAVGVALGAFAAHGLKAILSPYLIGVFQTGVQYQFIHVLAVLALWCITTAKSEPQSAKIFFPRGNLLYHRHPLF